MNILYCGDANIEKGLIISVMSLVKSTIGELHIWVMTMSARIGDKAKNK